MRPRKNLKLIVHLERPGSERVPLERLPLRPSTEDVMGVSMGKVTIEAMQGIDLKVGGTTISITPTGISMKGPMVTLEGDAMAQVKAPITQINGDGMVMIKGGITMIN